MGSVLWLRRDLRRRDHPALLRAAEDGPVTVLFVLDPALCETAGPVRSAWLAATLMALRDTYDGRLVLRLGDPAEVVPAVAREVGASSVHVSSETEPYGTARDARVRAALEVAKESTRGPGPSTSSGTDDGAVAGPGSRRAGAGLAALTALEGEAGSISRVETGSPYAVTPGRVRTKQGGPYSVFTPFSRAWRDHGWRSPAADPEHLELTDTPSDPHAWALVEAALATVDIPLPPAGEDAALEIWHEFLDTGLDAYASDRNRADLAGTSRLSPYLKFGVIHPRTLLADLAAHEGHPGADRFITELAWREFYADVLHHHPESADHDLRPSGLTHATPDESHDLIAAWKQGRTGFPFVDAGMRQLLETGWMHNRVRMVVASFLCKDLHAAWQVGAQHFMDRLLDGDVASNAHGWQWVAGTGTDPAVYTRVFNPVLQGRRFDPRGDYVRRWIPELRHIAGADVHEPWDVDGAYTHHYPTRILDHAEERKVALARWADRARS